MKNNKHLHSKILNIPNSKIRLWLIQIIFTLLFLLQSIFASSLGKSILREEFESIPQKVVMGFHGGGGRGLISAYILQALETKLPSHNINDYVTHYAGNSTGSIMAAGLASGKTVSDMINFYLKDGPEIFSSKARNWSYPLINPNKYDRAIFDQKLADGFGNLQMGHLEKGLLVMADQLVSTEQAERGPVYFNSERENCRDFFLRDVVGASCSAPTIFEPSTAIDGYKLIDGGLVENNPSMGAFYEFSKPGENVFHLSIGTGRYPNAYDFAENGSMSVIKWATAIPHLQTRGVSLLTDRRLEDMLGKNYIHFNPELEKYIELDDLSPKSIEEMQVAVMQYISTPEVEKQLLRAAAEIVLRHGSHLRKSQLVPSESQSKD